MMEAYETWPGFLRLRKRLQFFEAAFRLNPTGSAFLAIDLTFARLDPSHRVYTNDIEILFPLNKREFEEFGNSVKLGFSPSLDDSRAKLGELLPIEGQKFPLHRVVFWAYSGYSNTITSTYNAQTLDEGGREIYVQSLGDGKYQIGLNAFGNLFDALLISDDIEIGGKPRFR
jgi:hypothetical protein